ncbi:hypothetical protein PENTCL1PPCAC_23720, partial [Pristionchus entomophagus]
TNIPLHSTDNSTDSDSSDTIYPCTTTFSFVRVPQMILYGLTAFPDVHNVSECQERCAKPSIDLQTRHFVCNSIYYNYDTNQCRLNSESRESKPDLFKNARDEQKIDYFDIIRTVICE